MTRFWLTDENNISTKVFMIGSTIFIQGQGLQPSTQYNFYLSGESTEGTPTLLARYSTDCYGVLPTIPLIPYVGVFQHDGTCPRSDADARRETAGRSFVIRAEAGRTNHETENLSFDVLPRKSSRWIFACDAMGRLQTGIEQRSCPVSIALRDFQIGCVQVSIVPRQSGWRVGDPIVPIATRKGVICRRVFGHDGSSERIVKLSESDEIPAGSYQFIARSFPLGWDEAGETTLLADDVVSDPQFASLVVRLPFKRRFPQEDGAVPGPEVGVRSLGRQYDFRLAKDCQVATAVYAACQPEGMPSGFPEKRGSVHVIRHETPANCGRERHAQIAAMMGP